MERDILLFRIKEYIRYRLRARNEHGIHSPFLFELYNELKKKDRENKDFYFAENFRDDLLSSDEIIRKPDQPEGKRTIGEEVASSSMPTKSAQLIYKLISISKASCVIELGTNAGVTALYMALAMKGNPDSAIYTIEGNADLHEKAIVSFAMLRHSFVGLPDINFVYGKFDEKLPEVLSKMDKLDFLFIDGDHRGEALIRYFEMCMPKVHAQTIFVVDDIYWSPDMLEAWKKLVDHPKVSLSVDMYRLGILFFNPAFSRQSFTLKW